MRTIKFRAKNLDGEWVYGFYVEEERQTFNGFEKKHFIVNDGYDYVNPDTVGQFTGLYDKDGKEIYEGDIVKAPYLDPIFGDVVNNMFVNIVVGYNKGSFVLEYDGNLRVYISDLYDNIEIIGNIYDNPELLTENERYE